MKSLAKPTRWRNRAYEDWVRQQGCVICGAPGEVHHAKGIGGMSGTSLKAPSWAAMCLCRAHHDALHQYLIDKEVQWEWIGKTLGRAIEEGVLVNGKP